MDYTEADYWAGLLNAGLCRLFVLRAVCREPAHGYVIRRRVADWTGGVCAPTEGSVYPILRDLERAGCLRSRTETRRGRSRIIYEATVKGRQSGKLGGDVWRRALPLLKKALDSQG